MSTTTTQTSSTPAKTDAPPAIVKCPHCGKLFDKESAALTPWQPEEYPKAMYKTVPKPKDAEPKEPEDEVQTTIAANEEEQKKLEGEGYSEDVPEPKDAAAKKPAEKKDEKKAEEPPKKRW